MTPILNKVWNIESATRVLRLWRDAGFHNHYYKYPFKFAVGGCTFHFDSNTAFLQEIKKINENTDTFIIPDGEFVISAYFRQYLPTFEEMIEYLKNCDIVEHSKDSILEDLAGACLKKWQGN